MSRSRKKNPITGRTNAASEKQDKRFANKRLRLASKKYIANDDFENSICPQRDNVSNLASHAKDGKFIFDANEYPDLLRK